MTVQAETVEFLKLIIGSGGVIGIFIIAFKAGGMKEQLDQIYKNHLPHIYKTLEEIKDKMK